MVETVGAYEAKTHLPKLLERVVRISMKGERITITKTRDSRRGAAAFHEPDKHIDIRSVIMEIRRFREKNRLSGFCENSLSVK